MTATRCSLIFRLEAGANDDHWEEFVSLYQPLIEHTVKKAGIAGCDVDDAVQDVLIQLVRLFAEGAYQRQRGPFRSWLRRVALNKAFDLRRRAPHRVQELNDYPARDDVDDLHEREFRMRLIHIAIQQMQRESRPITWYCFEHHVLKHRAAAEVGEEVGLTENAVYVNSSRVMSRIRHFCALHGEDLADVCV